MQLTFVYILIGISVLSGVIGFGLKTNFPRNLKYSFPAVLFTAAIFIIWDFRFEEQGIWRYSNEQLIGISFGGFLLEPVLYQILLPLLALSVYEWVKSKEMLAGRENIFLGISLVLMLVFILLTYVHRNKLYTFFTFFLTSVYFAYTIFRNRFKKHYISFFISYLLLLLPVILINALLIGIPVIAYNPDHILGILILGIPIENFVSFFLQLLMCVSIYEFLYERKMY